MKKLNIELAVGFFVLIGIVALGYLSVKLGRMEIVGKGGYAVYAEFEQAGGIRPGSVVEIAGVEVGKVQKVELNEDYMAVVKMVIEKDVKLQEDSIASVKTKGLIGEKYIQILPGASERLIADGGSIRETESAVDYEEILSKYIFGKVED